MSKLKKNHIDPYRLQTTKMFSRDGWKQIWKQLPIKEYVHADGDKLAEGFCNFVEIWMEDNGYNFDWWTFEIFHGKQRFYDEDLDQNVFYEGDLEEDLLQRWSEYLLED